GGVRTVRGELQRPVAGNVSRRIALHPDVLGGGKGPGRLGLIAGQPRGDLKSPAQRGRVHDLHRNALPDARRISVSVDKDPAGSLVDRRSELVVALCTGEAAVDGGAGPPDRLSIARGERRRRRGRHAQDNSAAPHALSPKQFKGRNGKGKAKVKRQKAKVPTP